VKHIHHKVPKYLGGTDDPENLIELTVEEHAEAHRILYEQHGRWEDRLAWLGLSGLISKEQRVKEMLSEAGKRGAAKGNANKTARRGPKPGEFKPTGTGGLRWFHNPEDPTQKCCLREGQIPPEGWAKGQGRKTRSFMTGVR